MDNLVDVNLVDRRCQPYWYFHYRYSVADGDQQYGSGGTKNGSSKKLAAGRDIRYRYLIATTEIYGSSGRVAFGSLGVSDAWVHLIWQPTKSCIPSAVISELSFQQLRWQGLYYCVS